MDISTMKNMVVLRDLPSNLIEEAIVVLKANKKIKKLEYSENKSEKFKNYKENNNKINKQDYIIKEAEFVISNYISKIESQDIKGKEEYKKLKEKYKKVDTSNWKEFVYSKIFNVKKGFYNKKPEHIFQGDIPFLGATERCNGVTEYYSLEDIEMASKTGDDHNVQIEEKLFEGNALCVTNNGSVGCAFFQPIPFTCSHDVNPLYILNGRFDMYNALFVATVIGLDKYRWDYGR